jgi:hypothetical protein
MTSDIDFEARLRRMAAALPVPTPSEGRLQAILLARGQARRNLVPADKLASDTRLLRWAGLAVAAATITLIVTSALLQPLPPRVFADPLTEFSPFLAPGLLAAQATQPSSPRIGVLDGSRLPVGRWVYAVQPVGEQVSDNAGHFDTMTVSRSQIEGRPTYILSTSWGSRIPRGAMVDSAWLTTDRLIPLRRVLHTRGGSALVTTFSRDSVVRHWFKPDQTLERLAAATPQPPMWQRGATVIGAHDWALFPLLSLHEGWQGHAAIIGIANTGALVIGWLDYRVTGEATVTVPAGTFRCWAVRFAEGAHAEGQSDFAMWVDKRTGWLIKEGQTANRFGRERVLVSFDSTPSTP